MRNSVCIVGVGALTSIGLNAPATAAAARAGIASFKEHPYMIDQEGEPYIVAMVPTLAPQLLGVERYVKLVLPAMEEALVPLAEREIGVGTIGVKLGMPEDRPGFSENVQSRFSEEIKKLSSEKYFMEDIEIIGKGHAAGLLAFEAASRDILAGSCEFCLVGGVDSYLDPETLAWLEENEQIHMPSNAWGFIPGEAASFCLLCSLSTAEKYNVPVRAQLAAISTAREENTIKTETVCIGKGLTLAVRNCVKQLPTEFRIAYTICDQNGEAYRADEFGFMLARLSEYFVDSSDYMAPADCWGDVGAASGPLFINLVIAAAEKGYAKGTHTLLWTSSEAGDRTAAVFMAEVQERGMV